jgi:hypothetical protein
MSIPSEIEGKVIEFTNRFYSRIAGQYSRDASILFDLSEKVHDSRMKRQALKVKTSALIGQNPKHLPKPYYRDY